MTDTTADGGQHLWTKVKGIPKFEETTISHWILLWLCLLLFIMYIEVTNSIQTDGTTQLKTGIIVAGTLTGVLIAGRGSKFLTKWYVSMTV